MADDLGDEWWLGAENESTTNADVNANTVDLKGMYKSRTRSTPLLYTTNLFSFKLHPARFHRHRSGRL